MATLHVPAITKDVNFTHRRGDTFEHTFLVKQKSDNAAVNFGVGATGRMIFSLATGSPSIVLQLTSANSKVSLTPASGQIDVSSLATDFDVAWTSASYEVEITHGDGGVFTYFAGTFTVVADLD